MLQVFLIFLTAVTFILMAIDPRSSQSTEAKSAWQETESQALDSPQSTQQQKDQQI